MPISSIFMYILIIIVLQTRPKSTAADKIDCIYKVNFLKNKYTYQSKL